jgi:muconolactone delta-isomerase
MQVAVTPDLGLLNQKLAQELAQVEAAAGPTVNRDRQDILGLQQNLPQLLKVVANYPNFALFDFQSKKEIHQVDLGEGFSIKSDGGSNGTIMEDELEFELFDAVRVLWFSMSIGTRSRGLKACTCLETAASNCTIPKTLKFFTNR